MAKEKSIETLIRECAKNRLAGKYNLAQYKEGGKRHEEKVAAITHKKVCESVVAFCATHEKVPFTFIIACGIQKDAHKIMAFNNGYKSFDADKVETVMKMGRLYNDYNGVKGKMTDVTWRLMTRYYERKSKSLDDFLVDLNASAVLGRACGERGDYDKLCANLALPIKQRENAQKKAA